MSDVPMIKLNNGIEMPQLGLGVYQSAAGAETRNAVDWALETGYRLIDTAALYGNEADVGQAVRESGIRRKEVFVTTKLWNSDHGYDKALRAFDESIGKLGFDYIDLYLIHWPVPAHDTISETWRAFERLYEEGRVRAIGVSNFKTQHLEHLLAHANVIPAVNQIELHPKMHQHLTRDFCAVHDIKVESWSPLMRGGELLENSIITRLAESYGKTPAQIIIRWHIDNGLIVIPKSVHQDRIRENFDVFDFALTSDEIAEIDELDEAKRVGPDPDTMNRRHVIGRPHFRFLHANN